MNKIIEIETAYLVSGNHALEILGVCMMLTYATRIFVPALVAQHKDGSIECVPIVSLEQRDFCREAKNE
jgi:hypothetical protein